VPRCDHEESGSSNGVAWLLKNHRELVDAEFVLANDGPDASEKGYADFQLAVTSPGGHSSMPVPTMQSITSQAGSTGSRDTNSHSSSAT